jgi:hypothetical protein
VNVVSMWSAHQPRCADSGHWLVRASCPRSGKWGNGHFLAGDPMR